MVGQEVLDIAKEAIWVMVRISAPLLLLALIVGLVISLVQALTQIQEMTLTFVPKILAIFLGLIFFLPLMSKTMDAFAVHIFDMIATLR